MKRLVFGILGLYLVSGFGACRYYESCVKLPANCSELETTFDASMAYGHYSLDVKLIDIFMCSTPIGNYYEQRFPNDKIVKLNSSVAHGVFPAPTSLNDIDPVVIDLAKNTAKVKCEQKVLEYNQLRSCQ